MSGKRRKYTPESREQAARLVIETGRPVAHVAAEIGVGEQVLGRWVRLARAADDAGNAGAVLDADERAELERLRRENAELRLDREFLKKPPSSCPNRTGRGLPGDRGGEGHLRCPRMCGLLEVSRSGFYKWRQSRDGGPSPSRQRRAESDAKVADFHQASDGVYGAPRILADLRAAGTRVSRKTAAALAVPARRRDRFAPRQFRRRVDPVDDVER